MISGVVSASQTREGGAAIVVEALAIKLADISVAFILLTRLN
jgi:hypothetical protein